MNFTDLEHALMIAVAVLLWRTAVLRLDAKLMEQRANIYAGFLIQIAKGEGTVVKNDNGWEFKPKEKHQ